MDRQGLTLGTGICGAEEVSGRPRSENGGCDDAGTDPKHFLERLDADVTWV